MAENPTNMTAISAPGKVLLVGGYLVLDRAYTGLVFGLSARINVLARPIQTNTLEAGVHLAEIVVESPQFFEARWSYGYHLADDDGGILVTQLRVGTAVKPNPFVETTLSYALTYVSRLTHLGPSHSLTPARLTILADNAYYSQPGATPFDVAKATNTGRFSHFPTTLSNAHKTGLGSSAGLVTALTAAVLSHYLPTELFDLASDAGRRTLHNLVQTAHCAAQGKVGSGFDVAAAVYGSCTYRRFSPSVLAGLPEPGHPGFGAALETVIRGGDGSDGDAWDTEIAQEGMALPPGVTLRMCDVDCGSQTVGMVKKVLAWRAAEPEASKPLWDELHGRNEALATALKQGEVDALPGILQSIRVLVRQMGTASGVPIEPGSQTELLDALSAVEGVYGGVVPGAGGFDAVSLLVRDDAETTTRLESFLEVWSKEKGGRVQLLDVKGEIEGVRRESSTIYNGWL